MAFFCNGRAAAAGEGWGHIAHIGDRHRHAVGGGGGVGCGTGADDQVVNIVAACIGGRLVVRAADKAHHPTAAVDGEPGRVGTAADAVCRGGACLACDLRDIDRTGGILGKCRTAAAGEGRRIACIGDCDRHALSDGMGVVGLGGADDDVINIVAAHIGGCLKVRAADKADHPAAVDTELGRVITAADAVTDAHGFPNIGQILGGRVTTAADAVTDAAPHHIGAWPVRYRPHRCRSRRM